MTKSIDKIALSPFGYIYKTTDLVTGLIYVGKHAKATFDPKYFGSGKIIKAIIKKCKKADIELSERFKVELIEFAVNLVDLDQKEIYWINKLNAKDRNVGYNIGDGGGSNILLGTKRDPDMIACMKATFSTLIPANNGIEWHWFKKDAVPEGWAIGQLKASEVEYRKRGAKATKTRQKANYSVYNDGIKNYWLPEGDPRCDTLILGPVVGSFSANKGKFCITDGTHRKYVASESEIPTGWYKGDFVDQSKINHSTIKNKVWITNGIIEKYIDKELDLPKDFI